MKRYKAPSADPDTIVEEADGKLALQRRVWNLLAKGGVFSAKAGNTEGRA